MGLDQYLYLRLPANGAPEGYWNVQHWSENQEQAKAIAEDLGVTDLMVDHIYVEDGVAKVEVAYWRKANQIHAWFVDNCQGGVDECQESEPVHVEQLAELVSRCKKVLADPSQALDLLPSRPGFFFGSYEVNEWYLEALKFTIVTIESVLRGVVGRFPGQGATFFYRSSW